MFLLYAVVTGLVIGFASGGTPAALGRVRLSWGPVIAVGLVLQVLLFTTAVGDLLGPIAPPVYVVSQAIVLAAVWQNRAIPGMPIVLLGGALNLAAIVANGGYMPVSADALAALGRSPIDGYTNNRLFEGVALAPLTDIFPMPAWLPLANIFSVGDVLIGVGVAVAIVAAMHGRGPVRADTDPASAPRPVLPADGSATGGRAP